MQATETDNVYSSMANLRREILFLVLPAICVSGVTLSLSIELFRLPPSGHIAALFLMWLPFCIWILLKYRFAAAIYLMLGACLLINFASMRWYPELGTGQLLGLTVGLATALIGIRGGTVTGVVASVMVLSAHLPAFYVLPTDVFTLMLIWGSWLLAYCLVGATYNAFEWSWSSFSRISDLLEEMRDQQVELSQTQADLLEAHKNHMRMYERLKAMNILAEQARQAKEEFVANVSHELRTPLNMIIGFSEMISRAPQIYGRAIPRALLADIAIVERNSRHLARLVDDVLDLSQVEAGRLALSKEWVKLQDISAAAIEAVQPLFASKHLALHREIEGNIPPLFCDSTRIRQVILNLLSNAGRFTSEGMVTLRIWSENNFAFVSVADTGPGIPAEQQEKLFEPFQQLDGSIQRRHGGSGLGLTISKRFVEMHNGKMWFESEEGVGTTFYFRLPYEVAPLQSNFTRWINPYQQHVERTHRPRIPIYSHRKRYVILDVGVTLPRLFERYTQSIDLVQVSNFEQAIAELNQTPAHLLIINTATVNDDAAIRRYLSQLPFGTPAACCWVPSEGDTARKLGIARYLVKPVARETLLSALKSVAQEEATILLVDDETEALQLFARMISSAGKSYRLLRAANGRQALTLLRERKPDVLVLDLTMPEMDGFEVLIRKNQEPALQEIPTIVISAKDPNGEPIASNTLTVMRSDGLSVRDLLTCMQSISDLLSPSVQSVQSPDPEPREMSLDAQVSG